MVGDDDQYGVRIVGEQLMREACHHAVERFEIRAGLRAEWSARVLRFVERA